MVVMRSIRVYLILKRHPFNVKICTLKDPELL